ncbi:signal peptidase I [Leucobacter insecticola]|uniref:Signal peptidase I n=1 Tax=Leucobacter insecticola TaxID=2714934 RepID=A0A6G8FKE0_9MICO|nr:signal peptidase I [Leucobacter insecticola]QIM16835.1 signal peptidase I [Leucobacter insecticola]
MSVLGVSAGVFGLVMLLALAAVIVPALTGASGYTILTRSMEPGLPPGSYIVVRQTPIAELEVGNIITFQLESGKPEVVTHRIQAIELTSSGERRFITRGDANAASDAGAVQEAQIKGQVWYVIPYLGFLGLFAAGSGKEWVTALAVTALFAYALANVVSWLRDRRRRNTPQ